MTHLKNAATGTEIEVDEATAKVMSGDGWEVAGDAVHTDDKPVRRSKAPQKGVR